MNRVVVIAALLFLACIPLVAANFRTERDPDGPPLAGDFPQEYMGAYIVLHGDRTRFYDLKYADELQHDPDVMGTRYGAQHFLPMVYPPFYYLLIAPLSLLPYYPAALVWFALMAGCLLLTVWLLARAYPDQAWISTWGLGAACVFMPVVESLTSNQKGTLVLLILTATFLLLRQNRPFWAGVVFGLLAFKPQLTLVIAIAMLCKRQWGFVLGGIVCGSVLVGLSFSLGIDVGMQYVDVSRNMAEYLETTGFPLAKMHCWYGFWKLLLPGVDLRVVQGMTLLTGLATIGGLVRLLWGPIDCAGPRFAMQFAGLVLATILLSPHLLTYDLTMLLLPFFLLTSLLWTQPQTLGNRRTPVKWLLIFLYAGAGLSPLLAQACNVQLSVLLFFALFVCLPSERDTQIL